LEIGSVTKVFTSLSLTILIADKYLSLATNAVELCPADFELPSYEGQEITLQHLVTHTSGLPKIPDNLSPTDPSNPYADYDTSKLISFLAEYELPRAPGTQFEYCNLGMALLGHVLEDQYGSEYE
jgi:CubicO group peptidase (beta-lactamase class C family)